MPTARQIMTVEVDAVGAEDSVDKVAELLLSTGHHSVPVLDGDRHVVGVISQSDLIDARKKVHLPTVITILDSFIPIAGFHEFAEDLRKATATTAGQLATAPAVTATAEEDVEALAERMAKEHIHAIPVVDGDNCLLGVVSHADILRALIAK